MRSSCRPQSELRPALLGLAQGYPVATRCTGHCIMCVAQDIKGHADLVSSPPSSQPFARKVNKGKNSKSQDTKIKQYPMTKIPITKLDCRVLNLEIDYWFLFVICFLIIGFSLCASTQRAGRSCLTRITDSRGCVRYPT